MNILFAADTGFYYFGNTYPGDESAVRAMSAVGARMKKADFSVINLETPFSVGPSILSRLRKAART